MPRFAILALVAAAFAILACPSRQDLYLKPASLSSDQRWIRQLDKEWTAQANAIIAGHTGSRHSTAILTVELACLRNIFLSRARAAHALATRQGIPLTAAKQEVMNDPAWIVAEQQCAMRGELLSR